MTDQQPSWRDVLLRQRPNNWRFQTRCSLSTDEQTLIIGPKRALDRGDRFGICFFLVFSVVSAVGFPLFIHYLLRAHYLLSVAAVAWNVPIGLFVAWFISTLPKRMASVPDLLVIDRPSRLVLASNDGNIEIGAVLEEVWTARVWKRGAQHSYPIFQFQVVHTSSDGLRRTALFTTSNSIESLAREIAASLSVPYRRFQFGNSESPKFNELSTFLKNDR